MADERWFTDEELGLMSRPTMDLAIEAIEAGDSELALELCRAMRHESRFLPDLMAESMLGLVTYIHTRQGDDGVAAACEERARGEAGSATPARSSSATAAMSSRRWRRPGAPLDQRQGRQPRHLTVSEDAEKFTFAMKPCGSGHRLWRNGAYRGEDRPRTSAHPSVVPFARTACKRNHGKGAPNCAVPYARTACKRNRGDELPGWAGHRRRGRRRERDRAGDLPGARGAGGGASPLATSGPGRWRRRSWCARGALGLTWDIRDGAAARQAHAEVEREPGPVGAVVANAAIVDRVALAEKFSEEARRNEIDVNLNGAFLSIQPALAGMRERGRIVAISSTAATDGLAGQAAYAASKAGVLGMVRTLALELAADGVTANAVLPGMVGGEVARPYGRPT